MSSPAQSVADRFCVQMGEAWTRWFDDADGFEIPGMMRQKLSEDALCQEAPRDVWPGFMLPDTLPILGNEYGDWICVRVTADGQFGELIHWYHGGGDWIPLGQTLAEALLHDAIDQFRPVRTQMLRGASESRVDTQAGVFLRLRSRGFQQWLVESQVPHAKAMLSSVIDSLATEDYSAALRHMYDKGWARDVAAADLVEWYLQTPIMALSSNVIAKAAEIPWLPDYVRLMFDVDSASQSTRSRILEACCAIQPGTELLDWPSQSWEQAGELAQQVLARRADLGWAAAIAGWAHEKNNNLDDAIAAYARGLKASSFSDQAVRFNCHADTEDLGKFAAVRLAAHRENWPKSVRDDDYVELYTKPRKRSLLVDVNEYWMRHAEQSEKDGNYPQAYEQYYASGWDMGVSRLGDYRDILARLARCAEASGWSARTSVAKMHLNCLQR